jgi:hypothetical protein
VVLYDHFAVFIDHFAVLSDHFAVLSNTYVVLCETVQRSNLLVVICDFFNVLFRFFFNK